MTLLQRIYPWIAVILSGGSAVEAFQAPWSARRILYGPKSHVLLTTTTRYVSPTGADIEQPPVEEQTSSSAPLSPTSSAIGSIQMPSKGKGKVNEIDFCIAPADASISRAYGTTLASSSNSVATDENGVATPLLSLTRALNNASNRAVRRILLARSWPSVEALNLSLRQVAMAEREALLRQQQQETENEQSNPVATSTPTENTSASDNESKRSEESSSDPKCPVPRPILNVLTRKRSNDHEEEDTTAVEAEAAPARPRPRGRTDEEYVQDQLKAFQERYGSLPGYNYAEAYLDSILSLATSGLESERAPEVLDSGVYDDAYRRIKAVLRTVGAVFVKDEATGRPVIAKKLMDQDICLSMLDKLSIRKESSALDSSTTAAVEAAPLEESSTTTTITAGITDTETEAPSETVDEESKGDEEGEIECFADDEEEEEKDDDSDIEVEDGVDVFKPKLKTFFKKQLSDDHHDEAKADEDVDMKKTDDQDDDSDIEVEDGVEVFKPKLKKLWKKKSLSGEDEVAEIADSSGENKADESSSGENKADGSSLSREDLGGVLLSAEEPTMTRQLNVLSNIVQRALLFGGDQELLVLSETLDADRAAFAERWYSGTGDLVSYDEETRPGLQYLNCLIALLRNCYNEGIITDLQPPMPLGLSYANAYERLVATSVELGSGYLKPEIADIMTMPSPRTATEELGRFAVWEAAFRKKTSKEGSAYPEDFVGEWEVRDEIGGETIGTSQVRLVEDGQVELAEPLEGLRWRCDPGPTHLDTCTFQVLSSDGTILQYRGFVDRGSRLESRVSKRPIKIRGKVMFQMRDGSVDYFKDMLPINYRQGTTSFVMTKIVADR